MSGLPVVVIIERDQTFPTCSGHTAVHGGSMEEQMTFTEAYHRHVRMVYNLSLNHLRNAEEASEATQDVFLKVHDKLVTFHGDSALRTWIYRITINTCLDRIKASRRKKRAFFGLTLPIGPDHVVADVPLFDHPGVHLERKERMEAVFAHIDRLPDKQRTALLLRATEGLSQNEIGEVMGLSAKAVESLLTRARVNLKQQLDRTKDEA
jgi:RNA polymerase sigma-70 factor (ECF subfamily)